MTTQQRIANAISFVAIAATAWALWRKTRELQQPSATQATTSTSTAAYPNTAYTVRGYRNNNPLNIEYTKGSNPWVGEILPSGDSRFAQFTSMAYGYRAAFKLLYNYVTRYGLQTLSQIITRWCPEDTAPYIRSVQTQTGWAANKQINPLNKQEMLTLVTAMSRVENGTNNAVPTYEMVTGYDLFRQSV